MKKNYYYEQAWGAITCGFESDLPECRKILKKLDISWDEFVDKHGETVMIVFTQDQVKKLPIDTKTLNKDTGKRPTGLYKHYLPVREYKKNNYSGHCIYPVTLFQLANLIGKERR